MKNNQDEYIVVRNPLMYLRRTKTGYAVLDNMKRVISNGISEKAARDFAFSKACSINPAPYSWVRKWKHKLYTYEQVMAEWQ